MSERPIHEATESELSAAYAEGENAYVCGWRRDSNPYSGDLGLAWDNGYTDQAELAKH